MGTDLERALREGMDRFTEPVTAPAGLAVRAYRQRRRRRFARRAAAAGTAIAAITAAVALSLGHGSPARPTTQAQTAAVVLRQVEAAVGADVIEHSDTAVSASRQSVIDFVWGDGVSVMPGSRWAVNRIGTSADRRIARIRRMSGRSATGAGQWQIGLLPLGG